MSFFDGFHLNVELVNDENGQGYLPTRAHSSDAGLDVYAPKDIFIPGEEDICIPLNFRVEFPEGYVLVVKEKSGIATKKKLTCGAAVIDVGYRGIVHLHLFNNGKEYQEFKQGEKVAQLLVYPVWAGQPNQVESVTMTTTRGTGGFGSTGV